MPPHILPTLPPPAVETCNRTGRRFLVLPEGEMIRSTDHCTQADMPQGAFITPVVCHGFPVRSIALSGLRYLRPLL
jgi:hypothetical protein